MNPIYFSILPNHIAREPRLLLAEFRVLIYLNTYKDPHPSRYQIANATGLGINAIDRALQGLRAAHVISWQRGGRGRPNRYTINPPQQWQLQDRSDRVGVGDAAQDRFETRQLRATAKAVP